MQMETYTSTSIFPALLKVLSDKSDEVVVPCLLVLAEGVAKKPVNQNVLSGNFLNYFGTLFKLKYSSKYLFIKYCQ